MSCHPLRLVALLCLVVCRRFGEKPCSRELCQNRFCHSDPEYTRARIIRMFQTCFKHRCTRVDKLACVQSWQARLSTGAFGCNPGRRACQQALRAKRPLTMRVFGCNPGGRACQWMLRAKDPLTISVFQFKNSFVLDPPS